jgi:hypothetical protein
MVETLVAVEVWVIEMIYQCLQDKRLQLLSELEEHQEHTVVLADNML